MRKSYSFFPPSDLPGIFGNIRRHFWLSQLGRKCYWHLGVRARDSVPLRFCVKRPSPLWSPPASQSFSYCLHLLPYQRGWTFVVLYAPLMCQIFFHHSAFACVCHSAEKVPNPHSFEISKYVSFFRYHLKYLLRKACPDSSKNINPLSYTLTESCLLLSKHQYRPNCKFCFVIWIVCLILNYWVYEYILLFLIDTWWWNSWIIH